jgi:hypothetical protein
MTDETREIKVKITFGNTIRSDADIEQHIIKVAADGTDSIRHVKELIATAAGGKITPDDILLSFPSNDRKLGKQYLKDPTVDESTLLLNQFSILPWLERFPNWSLSARLLPPPPPPPGVAIQRAAAVAEQKDPERAIQDARAKGDIPKINDLPSPWGPKEAVQPPREALVSNGYLPAKFPDEYSPLVDKV